MSTRRDQAPLGQLLAYQRAAGAHPQPTQLPSEVRRCGWSIHLPAASLGDTLLGLAAAAALDTITGTSRRPTYDGPRAALMSRCTLRMSITETTGDHTITVAGTTPTTMPVEFPVIPEAPPTWLELLTDDQVGVHAALPMRYYLALEQQLGTRLPAESAPAPTFHATTTPAPGHVVFVCSTSRPERKDYGAQGFAGIAQTLSARRPGLRFSLIRPHNDATENNITDGIPAWDDLGTPDAVDCLDIFGTAELVIGNDTGLTHLAALTNSANHSSPCVVGLYSRHAHTKWITGRRNHHAVATAFSAMLSTADRCPVRDTLDDTLWATAAAITALDPAEIAHSAGHWAGWW